jgi:hypothetical protein
VRRTSHFRYDAVTYLRAESLRLSADCERLRREFEAIRERPFDWDAHATFQRKLRQFRGLLANHRLALDWTANPPGDVNARRCRGSRGILARRTDFQAVAIAADPE